MLNQYTSIIYVICPDTQNRHGGIRKLYNHVDILNKYGFSAFVLHEQADFRCNWFENSTQITYKSEVNITPKDILVIPEVYGQEILDYYPGVKKVIFNQNTYYTFQKHDIDSKSFYTPYLHEDILGVIVVSEDNKFYLNSTFTKLKVYRIHYGFNFNLFAYIPLPQKKNKIAFMTSKNFEDTRQVINIIKFRNPEIFSRYEWIPIENKTETEVAKILGESGIFLWSTYQEGFGMPPVEAMACGSIVVGYDGLNQSEFMQPEFSYPVRRGDVIGFADRVEEVINTWENDPQQIIQKTQLALDFVKREYSPTREEEDIIQAWREILTPSAQNPILVETESHYRFKLHLLNKELEQSRSQHQQTQAELEQSRSQHQQTQGELEQSRSQHQQAQAELEQSRSQHQQTQGELEQSRSQHQQTQGELEQSRSQHQQIQAELEQSRSQYQQIQAELEQSHSQHQQTQTELENSVSQLNQTQQELEQIKVELLNTKSQLLQSKQEQKRSQSQLYQVQSELDQTLAHLHSTKMMLEQLQTQANQKEEQLQKRIIESQEQLQKSEAKFEQEQEKLQSELYQTKQQLKRSQSILFQTQVELEQSQRQLHQTQQEFGQLRLEQALANSPDLEDQFDYRLLVWKAWSAYCIGDLTQMSQYLRKSMKCRPYSRSETVLDWIESFTQFSAEKGTQLDVEALTSSEEWKQLIHKITSVIKIIK